MKKYYINNYYNADKDIWYNSEVAFESEEEAKAAIYDESQVFGAEYVNTMETSEDELE